MAAESKSHAGDHEQPRATAWLSRGWESLLAEIGGRRQADPESADFDLIIVGSGYGGAVALSRLAGWRDKGRVLRVALLERGKEYLPGAFPDRFAELPGQLRWTTSGKPPNGARSGLFDVRTGPDVQAIVANGLGGGSLINAGVMAMPHPSVFAHPRWPSAVQADAETLAASAASLKRELGAGPFTQPLSKRAAMDRLAGGNAAALDITVATQDGLNAQGVSMHRCLACGDCFTGCNHGAKASLDVTLLIDGRQREGVEVFTGATVLQLAAAARGGWNVDVVHTDLVKRRREGKSLSLRAPRVILAAGTFGSTAVLMRSREAGLRLSPMLGHHVSANGDGISTLYDMREEVSAVADESVPWAMRRCGPTITACLDHRTGDPATDVVIQDLTVPGALRRVFEQITVTANALDALGEPDSRRHVRGNAHTDPNAVDPAKIERSLLVATIGHDDAVGQMVMESNGSDEPMASIHWPDLRHDPRFAERHRLLEDLVRQGAGGRVLANPMWRALPETTSDLLGIPLGSVVTVHPLGGCGMGEHGGEGVVDDLGRVFCGSDAGFHEGLLVLDGSIVPTSLGINPALTITLLADRAVRTLRDAHWKLEVPNPDATGNLSFPRPHFRPPALPAKWRDTQIVISEQLRGRLTLERGGRSERCLVELEIVSRPVAVSSLMAARGPAVIELDPSRSAVRIFGKDAFDAVGALRLSAQLETHRLSGTLTLFGHATSTPRRRQGRALWAWFRNRGFRDAVQEVRSRLGGTAPASTTTIGARVRMALALASRAGDARELVYRLRVEGNQGTEVDIEGVKTLTYAHLSNPWNQLMEVSLQRFPGWKPLAADAKLTVDLTYFEKSRALLLQIVDAENLPSALLDLGAFGGWLLRTLLHVHVWSFRQPDLSPVAATKRLPGRLPGLPPPEIVEFLVGPSAGIGRPPALARLTRYRRSAAIGRVPVLMIHGYSASGTTFAHPAIPEGGLAGYLGKRDRDAWVLDLRSSCGMPTATDRWSFEQIGYSDIPLAIERVLRATGASQLDIVAHCMGSAMLLMALMGAWPSDASPSDPDLELRRKLPARIRRLVLSQVGPKPVMSPANVSRAYALRFLQAYLPLEKYSFRVDFERGGAEQVLDRLLATVPYPADEFKRENPLWPPGVRTPWVGTRHRMDALYGMTFALENMTSAVLDRLDDFFGPMNARTLTQVIHFTRGFRLADARGRSLFEQDSTVPERVVFPVLSLHARKNGLVDVTTRRTTDEFFSTASAPHTSVELDSGHQDSLIGRRAAETFAHIANFLESP